MSVFTIYIYLNNIFVEMIEVKYQGKYLKILLFT